jgi:hypothetical protein
MMKICIAILLAALLTGCKEQKEEEVEYSANQCKRQPAFVSKMGFNPGRTAFSTSDSKKMGLLMMEIINPNDTSANGRRIYQHPSWKSAGWLAPIQIDHQGNIFLGPAPLVNVLYNQPDKQNQLQKVDVNTGEMKVFADLAKGDEVNEQNPFGILGLAFYCDNPSLYVSSVAGSSRSKEAGRIYRVDPETGNVKDQLAGVDAFGMGFSSIEGKRKLYFGKARTSEVYSIGLTAKGDFIGTPKRVLSLEGLGPRGDDKAKKITFTDKREMVIEGYEFNFNLIAPTEKQLTQYTFRYNPNEEKWVWVR